MPPRTPPLAPALLFLRELWALDHALVSASKRMHDRMGVTAEQRMVLRFVGERSGITAAELASLLHLEKSTLSLSLKRLEARGLVSREPDANDRRKTHIALTQKGRAFGRPAPGTVEHAVRRALDVTNAADVETIRSFLQRLVELLEAGDQRLAATSKQRIPRG